MRTTKAVREHPMIFGGESILAIRDKRKLQTRRLVSSHNTIVNGYGRWSKRRWGCLDLDHAWVDPGPSPAGNPGPYLKTDYELDGECLMARLYPQWQVGDRLWVKETWCQKVDWNGYFVVNQDGETDPSCYHYRADGYEVLCSDGDGATKWNADGTAASPWQSPIFMSRCASRILLEVTGVRPEYLQELSQADAMLEGVTETRLPLADTKVFSLLPYPNKLVASTPRDAYRMSWDYINGKRAMWESNPPVWVITFKPIICP